MIKKLALPFCAVGVLTGFFHMPYTHAQSISTPVPTTINVPTPTIGTSEPVELTTHETVSVATGQISFFLPIVSLPQRGGQPLNLGFVLSGNTFALRETQNTYQSINDALNDLVPTHATVNNAPTLALPWYSILHPNLPTISADLSYAGMDSHNAVAITDPPNYISNPEYCMQNWTFVDWDASSHFFNGTRDCSMGLNGGYFLFAETLPLRTQTSTSVDDKGYILDATNSSDIRVTRRDGTVYHFTGYTATYPQNNCNTCSSNTDLTSLNKYSSIFSRIIDNNGNVIQYSNGVLTDTIGRQITVNPTIAYRSATGSTVSARVAEATANQTDPWPVQYAANGPCQANYAEPNKNGSQAPQVIYQGPGTTNSAYPAPNAYTITLQNGAQYVLTFDVTGNLIKVVYPGGGYTRYDYLYGRILSKQNFGDVTCVTPSNELLAWHECPLASGSCAPATTVTTINSCVAGQPAGQETTTCRNVSTLGVTNPAGNLTIHQASGAGGNTVGGGANQTSLNYPLATFSWIDSYYSGSSTLLKTVTRTFGGGAAGCTSTGTTWNNQPCSVTTTYNDVTPPISGTINYQYDTTGAPNITQIQELDFSGSAVKTTNASWEHGGIYQVAAAGTTTLSNVLDHLQNMTVIDGITGKTKTNVFTYDALGNLQQSATSGPDVASFSTLYTPLDAYGRPTQLTDPKGNVTKFSYTDSWYDSSCPPASTHASTNAYLTSVTNALGQISSYAYDSCTGALGSTTDANNAVTSFAYDALGRLTQVVYPDGGMKQASYVDSPPEAIQMTQSQSPNPNVVINTILDGFSRVSQTQVLTDPSGTDFTDTTYDGLGQTASVSNPYRSSGTTSTNGITQFGYDALGRKTRQLQPDGTMMQWCFNGKSDPQNPQSNCRAKVAGFNGTWVDEADEAGNDTQRVSDAVGRLRSVIEPYSYETDYAYDGFSDLQRVDQWGGASGTSGERQRNFLYDSLSRLTSAANPETGTVTFGYDLNSNLTSKVSPLANVTSGMQTLSYGYDSLNRKTSQTASDGSVADTYYYDQGGAAAYANGRLTVANHNNVASNGFGYDSMGRVLGTSYAEPGSNGWQGGMAVTYDKAGHAATITYPDQRQVQQTFDGAGRLATITSNAVNLLSSPSYLPSGALQGFSFGDGVSQTTSYNNRLQPCRTFAVTPVLTAPPTGSGNLFDRQSYYQKSAASPCGNQALNNGNILAVLDSLNASQSQAFSYDSLNRVTAANRLDNGYNHTYSYDPFGNLTIIDNLHTNPTWSIDPATNELLMNPVGGSTDTYGHPLNQYTYDHAGNMVSSGPTPIGHSIAYNALSQVMSLDGGTDVYDYNGLDERAFKQTATSWTDYVFLNGLPMAEQSSAGTWTDYVYANGSKIARIDSQKPLLNLTGTRTSANDSCGVQGTISGTATNLAGIVIAAGDKLVVDMQQTVPTYGGIALVFTNGTGSGSATDVVTGQPLFSNGIADGKWHHLSGSLASSGGLTISYAEAGIHSNAYNGSFSLNMANAAILHSNGSITPVFTGQTGTSVANFSGSNCGGSSLSSGTVLSATTDPTINTNYFVDDHLGTAQMELTGGGWPVWQGQFTPFGSELPDGVTDMHYKFTGKERDTESGLDYFGARYYGSSMGRWMSPDWAAKAEPVPYAKLDNPQSLNLYQYVGNNPLSRADADGHDFWDKLVNLAHGNGFHDTPKPAAPAAPTTPAPQPPAGSSGPLPALPTPRQTAQAEINKSLQQYQASLPGKGPAAAAGVAGEMLQKANDNVADALKNNEAPKQLNVWDVTVSSASAVVDAEKEGGRQYPLSLLSPNGPDPNVVFPSMTYQLLTGGYVSDAVQSTVEPKTDKQ